MSTITSVTASLMILLDEVLDLFATAQWTNTGSACVINGINASLTNCGVTFVDALVDLTLVVTRFTSDLFLGLDVL